MPFMGEQCVQSPLSPFFIYGCASKTVPYSLASALVSIPALHDIFVRHTYDMPDPIQFPLMDHYHLSWLKTLP